MNNMASKTTQGEFVTLSGQKFYKIENVDGMAPFFISLISSSDHWLFAASNGGLTAGRVSPETALFPYVTVDKIYDSAPHTGCRTIIKLDHNGESVCWQPYNELLEQKYDVQRNLYKNVLGSQLCFEEINHSLQLAFRYTWATSEEYGFVRQVEVQNLSTNQRSIHLVDGLVNLLPAGTPRFTQAQSSNLVDAYKFNEIDEQTGVALFTLYSGITDRAEPSESLRANTVFVTGVEYKNLLLTDRQLKGFKQGESLSTELDSRGIRGDYYVHAELELAGEQSQSWRIVANIDQDQSQIVELMSQLDDPDLLHKALNESILAGDDALAKIMGSSDGFQQTAEQAVDVHHYANTLFNVLRGGIFNDQYQISTADFAATLAHFNKDLAKRHHDFLSALPEMENIQRLLDQVQQQNDQQLTRLALEYLPITFGRRHGDPSRPWNQFAINLKDKQGNPLLSYQGNWRDIFQNCEALTFSYLDFIESVIAKFVNASTMDGYNPYRITKEGIDWEVEEPDDPWSYIGYWGDHQIIYLLKMLELSKQFHPEKLSQLLTESVFSYANVPYRITSFENTLKNAKSTVSYDEASASEIEARVERMGADGKMVLDADGNVYQVNLLEKLLVPLLSKLSNLVVDGGIWLNTQRPEWNDANNALVGQGLSMVTLYYMRRYIRFMQSLIADMDQSTDMSSEVSVWLQTTHGALAEFAASLQANQTVSMQQRYALLDKLGRAGSEYRLTVYASEGFSQKTDQAIDTVKQLLDSALVCIDRSIAQNRDDDGLYHAYNVIELGSETVEVGNLYPMLEGQVAALSSGAIKGEEAVEVIESLFASDIYRDDQHTFMLYPDRQQTRFLKKNSLPTEKVTAIGVVKDMLAASDNRIIGQDKRGVYRFNADIKNAGDLEDVIAQLASTYSPALNNDKAAIFDLYESVFDHQSFTGRSGGMFGFEGLGSIYWHMVSKLLLAVNEQFFQAIRDQQSDTVIRRLGELYYRIRFGIGFNKTPQEYGAFPTDPYSHTPKHAGAQQPGMTGQVKEEVLSRFAELGVVVNNGKVSLCTRLLRTREFSLEPTQLRYLTVNQQWQEIHIPANGIGFTWCQVPFVYELSDSTSGSMTISYQNGQTETVDGLELNTEQSALLFDRSGEISQIHVLLNRQQLFTAEG